MQTNAQLANVAWTLSAEGLCGASITALSYLFSSPWGLQPPGGKYVLTCVNDDDTAPLHIESRVIWTDNAGTVRNTPYTQYLLSNTQSFGGSAAEAHTLVLVLSGGDVSIPLDVLAGSGLQVVILAASDIASATIVSGFMSLWRV